MNIHDNVYKSVINAIYNYGYTEKDVYFIQVERVIEGKTHTFQFSLELFKKNSEKIYIKSYVEDFDNLIQIVFNDGTWLYYWDGIFHHKKKIDFSELDIVCVDDNMYIDLEDFKYCDNKKKDMLEKII